ncbi:MAG: hypothetical protein QOG63_786 [Thermoleophilaceae bacterium]|nr:hypothetical protein [Thermoleophilaceae bacterium]
MRWRLIGAWRWPLFAVVTFVDALIVQAEPPVGAQALFFPALFLCSFANLFLIGAVAPWLARRLRAREAAPASFPPAAHHELLVDRIACTVLVLGAVGLLIAGLGNQKEPVCVTDRVCHLGDAVKAYVDAHAPAEVQRNIDLLDSHQTQEDGFFRACVAFDDRRRAYCMFVDANKRPPTVVPDHDTRPNGIYFRTP